jgi:ubiquinone/menaquinone biosynthesis C-methylase UbiE
MPAHEREDRVRRQARRQFAAWAPSYDRSALNELVFYPSIRACQEEILRWQRARGPQPFRMLDVGCGTGTLLDRIAQDPGAERLMGVDYSPEMVAHASRKFASSPHAERMLAVNADAERLPFADASLDVITCCNSFHHYPHQTAVLRGFRRCLRPGGLLVLIDGFRDNLIGWLVFDVAVALVERHVHHASWSEVRTAVLSAGFRTLTQRKLNVFAPLLVNVAQA